VSLLDLPVARPRPLAGRVILLCGAHGALGSAAAEACAAAGATLVLMGRRLPKLNRIYDAVAQAGPEPVLYPLDLEGAGPQDYADMAQRLEAEFGRLDGVLHCAADFRGLTPLEHIDPAVFASVLHVNLTAPWWLLQACLPLLRRSEDASVVVTVDDPARVGQAYWGSYGVAQHGLRALVGMLGAELAGSGIRVAGLHPGPMRTPLRARAYAEDSAHAAADPQAAAQACVELLSTAGRGHAGQILELAGTVPA
jgi:NAD(P)-dependent dehydrogenase (short-subunit alcohol dehydrogenase family)